MRSYHLFPPIRAKLDIKQYGRPILEKLINEKLLSLLHLYFIDRFGLYRNNYQSLMSIYLILFSLPLRNRTCLFNIFLLTLGSHGSVIKDILKCLVPALKTFKKGVYIDLCGLKQKVVSLH